MLWCIAPAPAGPCRVDLRIDDLRHAVELANAETRLEHKDIAAAMGFGYERIGLYYRQLRQHGLNFNLLLNVEPRWWLAFIVHVTKLLGITAEQIAKAFGIAYQTEEEVERERQDREARDKAVDDRLRRLEQLAGVPAPAPVTRPSADEDPSDAKGRGDRCHRGYGALEPSRRGDADTEAGDLRAVQVPLQGRAALPNLLGVRVGEWT